MDREKLHIVSESQGNNNLISRPDAERSFGSLVLIISWPRRGVSMFNFDPSYPAPITPKKFKSEITLLDTLDAQKDVDE